MTSIFRKLTPIIVLAALVAFAPARLDAAPIAVTGPTVTITTAQNLGVINPGTLLAQMVSPFSINSGQLTGNVLTAVYRNASGFLDFYYQVVNTSSAVSLGTSVSAISGANFTTYSTSIAYTTSAFGFFATPTAANNGTMPRSATRVINGNGGSQVNAFFGPPFGSNRVDAGEKSAIIQISTNGRNWGIGTSKVQNGSPSAFQIVTAFQVPEPASLGIAALGFAMLARAARRRQK